MEARGPTGPVLDLVRMEAEAAPMRWARHVCFMEAGMHLGMLGFERVPVLDGRGLVGHPRTDLRGPWAGGEIASTSSLQRRHVARQAC